MPSRQRWSKGHKARGQEHPKNPRPWSRIHLPRTDILEAKGKNDRGKGQEHNVEVFLKK